MSEHPMVKWAAARAVAIRTARYLASRMTAYPVVQTEQVPTCAMTDDGVLLVNPKFIETIKDHREIGGCWLHETLHDVLRDGPNRGTRDPEDWNLACDLRINQMIRDNFKLPLPSVGAFPEKFGFPPGLTAAEYYELIKKARAKAAQQQGQGGKGKPLPGSGTGVCDGKCGSIAGNPGPGEAGHAKGLGRSQAARARADKATAGAIQNEKSQGTVPAELQRWAQASLQPPVVSWQTELAHAARYASALRPGSGTTLYTRPSRKQAALGFGPGRPVLPQHRLPMPRIALAVDTSGSMGGHEIAEILTEAQAILSLVGEVQVLSCDADVHGGVQRVRDLRQIKLRGGGGTAFEPVFDLLERTKPRPDIVVYGTDGYGSFPASAPAWCKTIWLMIGGTTADAPWGKVIRTKKG